MTDVIEAIDWSSAQMTDSAKNVKVEDRMRVVQVPREVASKYAALSWPDVEAAAARRADGVALWLIYGRDRAPKDAAYFREGRYTVTLKGRPCLYSQGWGKDD